MDSSSACLNEQVREHIDKKLSSCVVDFGSFFQIMLNEVQKNCEKWYISVDVKANKNNKK